MFYIRKMIVNTGLLGGLFIAAVVAIFVWVIVFNGRSKFQDMNEGFEGLNPQYIPLIIIVPVGIILVSIAIWAMTRR